MVWTEYQYTYNSFVCVLMSVVWYKVLAAIDICNKVIQARDVTSNVKVSNIETLLEGFMKLQSNWKNIWNETKEAALNLEIEIKLSDGCAGVDRKRTRMHNDANLAEMTDTDNLPDLRKSVFYV